MLVQETFVNRTRNAIVGESEPYEPYTDNTGRLFRAYQREHGRCISKMYADGPTEPIQVGWVFLKRQKYDDCNETYLSETWVTLYESYEKKTVVEYTHHKFV